MTNQENGVLGVYLGHVVTPEGIFPDLSKVEVVKNFPTPASLKELKSFLGLANYYLRFIRGFSEISSPPNALTKKGVKFFGLSHVSMHSIG